MQGVTTIAQVLDQPKIMKTEEGKSSIKLGLKASILYANVNELNFICVQTGRGRGNKSVFWWWWEERPNTKTPPGIPHQFGGFEG